MSHFDDYTPFMTFSWTDSFRKPLYGWRKMQKSNLFVKHRAICLCHETTKSNLFDFRLKLRFPIFMLSLGFREMTHIYVRRNMCAIHMNESWIKVDENLFVFIFDDDDTLVQMQSRYFDVSYRNCFDYFNSNLARIIETKSKLSHLYTTQKCAAYKKRPKKI